MQHFFQYFLMHNLLLNKFRKFSNCLFNKKDNSKIAKLLFFIITQEVCLRYNRYDYTIQ